MWDLDERCVHAVIKDAHEATVVSMEYYPNEPILLTTGADNGMKMWIFDKSGGEARLLKQRSGHRLPPTSAKYYGGQIDVGLMLGGDGRSHQLLTTSRDRSFRVMHAFLEHQSTALSQGHVVKKSRELNVSAEELKLPPIISFDSHEV